MATPKKSSEESGEAPGRETAKETVTRETVTVRRSPRYLRFFFLGVILGVIVDLILLVIYPVPEGYSTIQIFGFVLLFTVPAGVVLGLVVALILDRTVGRRTRTAEAEHTRVD